MTKPLYGQGIGKTVRERWSGDRQTPTIEQQYMGFFTGTVMDDFDEQRMGRIWVYVSGISARRFDTEGSVPSYGGTTPDRDDEGFVSYDKKLRLGWILCYPMMPFFGSDDYRVKTAPGGDFRNAENGDVSSYGMWYQPRNGDEVGIMFAQGDPAKAFWIGCIPKHSRNFMVPGSSGRPPSDLDGTGDPDSNEPDHPLTSQIQEEFPEDALVPSLDKARRFNKARGLEQEQENVLAAHNIAFNIRDAGLICDPQRGAGNSSSRRESPSYVTGIKSQGWVFDSEKRNLNTASGNRVTFQDSPDAERYRAINTTGHQFVMDDHPDFQSMRFRTSAGSQIYFNDSSNEPYIYISTAKGNVWLELSDDGNLHIFSEGSLNIHSREDINFTADRDVNIDAQRDLKIQSRRNTELKFKGSTNIEMGRNDLPPQSLNYNDSPEWGSGSLKDAFIQTAGGFNITTDGKSAWTIGESLDITASGDIIATAAGDLELKGGKKAALESATRLDLKAGSAMNQQSGANFSVLSGGIYSENASQIRMNSSTFPASSAIGARTASKAGTPKFTDTIKKPIAPTIDQIYSCEEPPSDFITMNAMVVPQHQPWPERNKTTVGLSGFVDVSEEEVSRRGATTKTSSRPLSFVGVVDGQPGVYEGKPYESDSQAEGPSYERVSDISDDERNSCSTYTTSDRLISFLKREEGFRLEAYPDAGNWAIGYGHNIKVGEIINGDTINGRVTQTDINRLNRSRGDLRITPEEAERLLREDLAFFERAVCRNIRIPITQGQFDALVSFTYNTGERNLQRMIQSSGINRSNFPEIPQSWMRYVKSRKGGVLQQNPALVSRRRRELEQFWST